MHLDVCSCWCTLWIIYLMKMDKQIDVCVRSVVSVGCMCCIGICVNLGVCKIICHRRWTQMIKWGEKKRVEHGENNVYNWQSYYLHRLQFRRRWRFKKYHIPDMTLYCTLAYLWMIFLHVEAMSKGAKMSKENTFRDEHEQHNIHLTFSLISKQTKKYITCLFKKLNSNNRSKHSQCFPHLFIFKNYEIYILKQVSWYYSKSCCVWVDSQLNRHQLISK